MAGKCIYCKGEINHDYPVDVCTRCGKGVWGEKMFQAILDGMKTEKEKGNMELGRVSETVAPEAGNIQDLHKRIADSRRGC